MIKTQGGRKDSKLEIKPDNRVDLKQVGEKTAVNETELGNENDDEASLESEAKQVAGSVNQPAAGSVVEAGNFDGTVIEKANDFEKSEQDNIDRTKHVAALEPPKGVPGDATAKETVVTNVGDAEADTWHEVE